MYFWRSLCHFQLSNTLEKYTPNTLTSFHSCYFLLKFHSCHSCFRQPMPLCFSTTFQNGVLLKSNGITGKFFTLFSSKKRKLRGTQEMHKQFPSSSQISSTALCKKFNLPIPQLSISEIPVLFALLLVRKKTSDIYIDAEVSTVVYQYLGNASVCIPAT